MPVTHGVASSSLVRTATREAEKLPFLVLNQQVTEVLALESRCSACKKKQLNKPLQAILHFKVQLKMQLNFLCNEF